MDRRTFTMSANLDNGLAAGTQYIVTPNVLNVTKEIVDSFDIGVHSFAIIGTYGTGKSSFLLTFESDLLNKQGRTTLLADRHVLHSGEYEIINIVGDTRPLSELLTEKLKEKTDSDEVDTLALLSAYYNKLKKKRKMLVIAIDEFGKILEHAVKNNKEDELYFFQKFCELVNESSKKILLLVTLHQNFSAYSHTLDEIRRNEWNKVKGRFKEIVFAEPVEQLLYLAAEHISSEPDSDSESKAVEELYALAKERRFVSADIPFETIDRIYPMDVFAAYTLTRAIQRYGQNERSLFTFLHAQGKHSLTQFVPSANVTYNVAEVYDYVQSSFYSYLSEPHGGSAGWNALLMSIERVEGAAWNQAEMLVDAVKVVKAIGMLNLFGNAGFVFSVEDMATYAEKAMGVKGASSILHELIRLKIVRYAEYRQRLTLFEGTDINIEDEIAKAGLIVPRPVQYVDGIRAYFNNRVAPVKAYCYHRGTPRYFDYVQFESPENIVPVGERDGYVQMIFPSADNMYEKVLSFSRECPHANVFVYFKRTQDIIEHLYNIQKYRYIIDKVLVDKSDRVALREFRESIKHEQALLNKVLNDSMFAYSDDVVWIYKGEVRKVESLRDFNRLLSTVCDDIYSLTPVFDNELINKHKISSSIALAKAKYLQAMLEHGQDEELGFPKDKFPPEKTIYYSLLKNTGLHTIEGFADKPSNPDIETLWQTCESFLESTREKSRPLSELVKTLSSQPYKIKDGLLEFWLPTYLYIKRQDYSLFGENGQFIPNITMELFDLMKKHMGGFRVKAYAVDGVKIQLFNQYRKFLRLGDDSTIQSHSFIETIKPFLFFYTKQLNDYAKHTKNLPHKETILFREVLANAKDPEKAFLEDLPSALGYDDNKLNESGNVQDYCSLIQQAVAELRQCYTQLIDRIERGLIERLGLQSDDYSAYVEEIHQRLEGVNVNLLSHRHKEFFQHAMTRFESRTDWYQSICYVALGNQLYRMRDEDEVKLHSELLSLFRKCEDVAMLSKRGDKQIDKKEKEQADELEEKIGMLLTGNDDIDVYALMSILKRKLNIEQ